MGKSFIHHAGNEERLVEFGLGLRPNNATVFLSSIIHREREREKEDCGEALTFLKMLPHYIILPAIRGCFKDSLNS